MLLLLFQSVLVVDKPQHHCYTDNRDTYPFYIDERNNWALKQYGISSTLTELWKIQKRPNADVS